MSVASNDLILQTNASLMLSLTVLGIFIERDKVQLAKLDAKQQLVRLLKAFDRGIENTFIFLLLFGPDKADYAAGKLKLSHRQKWPTGLHRPNPIWLRSPPRTNQEEGIKFDSSVLSMLHIVDRPLSCSIIVQKDLQLPHILNASMLYSRDTIRRPEPTNKDWDAIVDIIKRISVDGFESGFFWAKRRGDCIELDLQDIPDQSLWMVAHVDKISVCRLL
ncbi:hypothetical protein C8J56DRAFT_797147 [Mycena floridula]|nr:hypothetical protein C8J56DRAFT_797147 [Mycena floridula]